MAELAAVLGGSGKGLPPAAAEVWQETARREGRPLLQLLALAEEQRRLLFTLQSLARLRRLDQRPSRRGAAPC